MVINRSLAFGAITIEGADRDAALLNGKTPDYFVGHGDEFNHNWWWKHRFKSCPESPSLSALQVPEIYEVTKSAPLPPTN
jgi:hypothetical protein